MPLVVYLGWFCMLFIKNCYLCGVAKEFAIN